MALPTNNEFRVLGLVLKFLETLADVFVKAVFLFIDDIYFSAVVQKNICSSIVGNGIATFVLFVEVWRSPVSL